MKLAISPLMSLFLVRVTRNLVEIRYFAMLLNKLAKFYHSPYKPLKIEQSPRGSQESTVIRWTEGVIKHCQQYLVK